MFSKMLVQNQKSLAFSSQSPTEAFTRRLCLLPELFKVVATSQQQVLLSSVQTTLTWSLGVSLSRLIFNLFLIASPKSRVFC